MKSFTALTALAGLLLSAVPAAAAEAPILSGDLFQRIAPTNPFTSFGLDITPEQDAVGLGMSPSPRMQGNEIGDALSEFSDPRAAHTRLEELKQGKGFRGGKVFGVFDYREKNGELDMSCGISRSDARDWDGIRKGIEYSGSGSGGSFRSFKLADRHERVRALARCLASLPGMPTLKPTNRTIDTLYVDGNSYRHAETVFKNAGLISSAPEDYRETFRCMISDLGRSVEHATGSAVVVRTSFSRMVDTVRREGDSRFGFMSREVKETKEIKGPVMVIAVVNSKAAPELARSRGPDDLFGIWPVRLGTDSDPDPMKELFGAEWKPSLQRCAARSNLIDTKAVFQAVAELTPPEKPCETPPPPAAVKPPKPKPNEFVMGLIKYWKERPQEKEAPKPKKKALARKK